MKEVPDIEAITASPPPVLIDPQNPDLGYAEGPEPPEVRGLRLWNHLAELVREDTQGDGSGHSAERALYVLSELSDEDVRSIAKVCVLRWAQELDKASAARYWEKRGQ